MVVPTVTCPGRDLPSHQCLFSNRVGGIGEETAQVTQLSLLARSEGDGGRHRGSSRT